MGGLAEPEPVKAPIGPPRVSPAIYDRPWPSCQITLSRPRPKRDGSGRDRSVEYFSWALTALTDGKPIEDTIAKLLEVSENTRPQKGRAFFARYLLKLSLDDQPARRRGLRGVIYIRAVLYHITGGITHPAKPKRRQHTARGRRPVIKCSGLYFVQLRERRKAQGNHSSPLQLKDFPGERSFRKRWNPGAKHHKTSRYDPHLEIHRPH
jgi:hypothetical protein